MLAAPVVWAIGYPDHPWGRPGLATLSGLAMVGAAAWLRTKLPADGPPTSTWLSRLTLVVAGGATFTATFWWVAETFFTIA